MPVSGPVATTPANTLQLKIGGMSCSFCANSISSALLRDKGVREAHVSLAHEEVLIRFAPEQTDEGRIKRTLTDLGYSEDQVKTFAAEYEIEAGPDNDGNMYMRPGIPSDYFPAPFENAEQAAASNNGAAPPDLSLMAKARGITRGFPTFVFDMFTQYQEGGPDYIYSLLTGYTDPQTFAKDGERLMEEFPEFTTPEGLYFNPYFANLNLAMAPPLTSEGQVTYDDGTRATISQMSKDVAAFLTWTAEPKLIERKQTGWPVLGFLLFATLLAWFAKKQIWAGAKRRKD